MPLFVVSKSEGRSTHGMTYGRVMAGRPGHSSRFAAVIACGFARFMDAIFCRLVRQPLPDYQIVEAPTIHEAMSKVLGRDVLPPLP